MRKMRRMDRGESVWLSPLLVIAGPRVVVVTAGGLVVGLGLLVFAWWPLVEGRR